MRRLILVIAMSLGVAIPAGAAVSPTTQVRHVDFGAFPQVRLTVVAPAGIRPAVLENGRPTEFASMHQLGSAEGILLAIDNSSSMKGAPLRQAKQAATSFVTKARQAGAIGLVAFGHEALPMTRTGEGTTDVVRTIAALAPDTQVGTSLYDAVELSVNRLKRMSSGTRILVLLTDGHDVGSHSSLSQATAAARDGNVIVYAIAAGKRADNKMLSALAQSTGGRLFDAADITQLTGTYAQLGQELDRTWQISYLSRARPGEWITLAAPGTDAGAPVRARVPGNADAGGGPIPASVVDSSISVLAAAGLAGLLLAFSGGVVIRRRRLSETKRLLAPHMRKQDDKPTKDDRSGRFEDLINWTEGAIDDLPGSRWLTRLVESSGIKLRVGHVPFIALGISFFLGVVSTIAGAGAGVALFLMLIGLASPWPLLRMAAYRRAKAFDRQLPDVLATIASTLRAGHGLRTAFRAVADGGSPPSSQEFSRVLGEERLGRPLDEAIAAMRDRIESPDLEYVATAINVQAQAGGSLATLFDTLSETVRERQRHARKVRALTSMGRMSATILISLPFGLAFLMTLISPSYMAPFYKSSTGHVLIIVCLTSMGIGALLLKRIVNVRY
jgi:tight adherence protein B